MTTLSIEYIKIKLIIVFHEALSVINIEYNIQTGIQVSPHGISSNQVWFK